MIGLAYRDNVPLGDPVSRRPLWPDRAVLLEQAFERRYFGVTRKGAAACSRTVANGMCRRLGYHPDPAAAGAWLPLLFLNGTSVATGRRILAGDVSAADFVTAGLAISPPASDVLALRGSHRADRVAEPARERAGDLFLSTAATMSCRSRPISPAGTIRDRTGAAADRIVDGGTSEDGALATAADIARALDRAGLRPIAIRIGDEPARPGDIDAAPARPEPPPSQDAGAFLDVAFLAVRGRRATAAGREGASAKVLTDALRDPDRLVDVAIRPIVSTTGPFCRNPTSVKAAIPIGATSWWVSQPVQAYLDAQLCAEESWEKLSRILRATRGPYRVF
jgi:hypothetical protein